MADWKKIARLAFKQSREWQAYNDENHRKQWAVAAVLAKAAGTPTVGQGQCNWHDMMAMALRRAGAELPDHVSSNASELDTRLKQARGLFLGELGSGASKVSAWRLRLAFWVIGKIPW